jgi:hypothetical protein
MCSTTVKLQIQIQLNALLFAKTLVRRDVASFAPSFLPSSNDGPQADPDNEDSTSKAQIMTLMCAEFLYVDITELIASQDSRRHASGGLDLVFIRRHRCVLCSLSTGQKFIRPT